MDKEQSALIANQKSCNDFHVIPNDEKKTIAIIPQVNGAFLELSKDRAKILAAIIQDCIQLW
jgi:hypothetical protein